MSSTKKTIRTCSWVVLCLTPLAIANLASAASVSVTNPSFETLPPGGLNLACGTACAYSTGGVIPGWTTSSTSSGEFSPGPLSNTTFFNTIPDGSTIAYMDATGTITQLVGTVAAANVVYTLLVDIGNRKDQPATGSVQLLFAGNSAVNATGVAATDGNWSTFTATYTTTAADIGKAITIQLSSGGVEGDFDNVRLDATSTAATPEPTTIGLFGLGLLGLGVIRRRKAC